MTSAKESPKALLRAGANSFASSSSTAFRSSSIKDSASRPGLTEAANSSVTSGTVRLLASTISTSKTAALPARDIPAAVPVIGPPLVLLLRGGESVGQGTLTRFYSAHTFVLPLAAAVLMLTHFLMIRKQGISGPL